LGFDSPEAIGDLDFIWAQSTDWAWTFRVGHPGGRFDFVSCFPSALDQWVPLHDTGYDILFPGTEEVGTIYVKESGNGDS
jgi:hypothetical protein